MFNFLAEVEAADNWEDYDKQRLTSEINVFEDKITELKQNLKFEIFDLEEEYKKTNIL